ATPDHPGVTSAQRPGQMMDGRLGQVFSDALLAAERRDDKVDDGSCRYVALSHRRIQTVDVEVAEVDCHRREALRRHEPLERQLLLAQRLGDGILSALDGLLAALFGEPLPDLVPGARALDELQPVP